MFSLSILIVVNDSLSGFRVSRNKNLHAMNQILNGIMEAGAMGRGIKLDKIQKQLIDACYANQYVVARQMAGHNIYTMRKGTQFFLDDTFISTYFNFSIYSQVSH